MITTSRTLSSTGEVVLEHLRVHHFALSLSGSIWERLEESVWLFRVAELFSCDFQTILHIADAAVYSSIGPCAHLYESTIDDYRLRVAQGSMGSLL